MNRTIRFYKKEDRWYADVEDYIEAGGTEEDCEMVAGANIWLQSLYDKNEREDGSVVLEISNVLLPGADDALHRICSDEYGAVYWIESNPDFLMWLCNVSRYVWGTHPDTIYYKEL